MVRNGCLKHKCRDGINGSSLDVVCSDLTRDLQAGRRGFRHVFLKEHMPKSTPAGLEVPREIAADYIERGTIDSIPTLVLETAISDHEWNVQGGADRNTLIDKFHLISALPYVDEIVSDDNFFHRLYPVAQKTG